MIEQNFTVPLSLSEIEGAIKGVPAEFSLEDLVPASFELDATIETDLLKLQAHGLEWREALAAQIVWARMYVAKLHHLQGLFEKSRH